MALCYNIVNERTQTRRVEMSYTRCVSCFITWLSCPSSPANRPRSPHCPNYQKQAAPYHAPVPRLPSAVGSRPSLEKHANILDGGLLRTSAKDLESVRPCFWSSASASRNLWTYSLRAAFCLDMFSCAGCVGSSRMVWTSASDFVSGNGMG